MKALVFCCCIFLACHCWGGEIEKECETPTPKILVLVSTSLGNDVYKGFYEVWNMYKDYDPEQVTLYFVQGNPKIKGRYLFKDSAIDPESILASITTQVEQVESHIKGN